MFENAAMLDLPTLTIIFAVFGKYKAAGSFFLFAFVVILCVPRGTS